MSSESDFAGELMNLCQYDLTFAVDWALIIKALPRVDIVHWHHMYHYCTPHSCMVITRPVYNNILAAHTVISTYTVQLSEGCRNIPKQHGFMN